MEVINNFCIFETTKKFLDMVVYEHNMKQLYTTTTTSDSNLIFTTIQAWTFRKII